MEVDYNLYMYFIDFVNKQTILLYILSSFEVKHFIYAYFVVSRVKKKKITSREHV